MSNRSFRGIRTIRFNDFELDVRAFELRREGSRVRLQEQPLRILTALLERPGEVISRDEIRKRLWPNDTAVEVSHGINAAVQRLREALGESAENPRFIETLARRGYRFIGPVEIGLRTPSGPPDSDSASAESTAPSAVSHFRVMERLGVGGMGVVYRAEDQKLGRHVALKFLPDELARDAASLARFRREAQAASALNHPNICTIYGVEECDGKPVIVMEYIQGESLEASLARGPLPVAKAVPMAIQMAGALDAAHRAGIVHRDLKPANVIVTASGVKMLDFGLAKMDRPPLGFEPPHVTKEGAILGTLHYLSPEQVQGKPAEPASDIFSFGVVLYEMLAGRRAFDGPNAARVMASILTLEPAPLGPAVPQSLDLALRRCLAKEPEERWQSARDLKAALELFATARDPQPAALPQPRPPAAPAPTQQPARSTSRYLWIAAAVFVVLALAAWYSLRTTGLRPVDRSPSNGTRTLPTASIPATATVTSPPPATATEAPRKPVATAKLPAWADWYGYVNRDRSSSNGTRTVPTALVPTPATVSSPPDTATEAPRKKPVAATGPAPANILPLTPFAPPTTFQFAATASTGITHFSLSPDGKRVAYISRGHLWIAPVGGANPVEYDMANGTPFWSPDGRYVAVTGPNRELRRFEAGTQNTIRLCTVDTTFSGAWSTNGTILIGLMRDGIYRVSSEGGVLQRVTTLDAAQAESRHVALQFLPDGRHFLFVAGSKEPGKSMLYAASLDSSARTLIMPAPSNVQYGEGFLVYVTNSMLQARPFNAKTLKLSGAPLVLGETVSGSIASDAAFTMSNFSVQGNTLAVLPDGRDRDRITIKNNWASGLR